MAVGVTCECEEHTIEAGALGVGNVMNSSIDDFVPIAFSICHAFYGLLLIYLVMDTVSSHSSSNYNIRIVNAKLAVPYVTFTTI